MEPTKKDNVTLGSLSPGDDTVRRWENNPSINDLIMGVHRKYIVNDETLI